MERRAFAFALAIALFAANVSLAAEDGPPPAATAAPVSPGPTEEQKKAAAEAQKYLDALRESFKHWMYEDYDLTQKDVLAGTTYPTKQTTAVLFSRHVDNEKYIVMHVEAVTSTKKALREKTDIWFDLSSLNVVTPADRNDYCTYRLCPLRIRFDDRPVTYVDATMGEKGQMTISKPLPIINEMKRANVAKVEVVVLDAEGKPQRTIFDFDVKGFKWSPKE